MTRHFRDVLPLAGRIQLNRSAYEYYRLPRHEYLAVLTLIHDVVWGEPRTVDGPDLLSPKYREFMIGHVARNSDAYRESF